MLNVPFWPASRLSGICRFIFLCGFLFYAGLPFAGAQSTAPSSQAPQTDSSQKPAAAESKETGTSLPAPAQSQSPNPATKAEVTVQDQGTTFRLNVNLVQVHVTVRDGSGKPVANLRKEDFLLYDQGKPQAISTFSVETRESRREKAKIAASSASTDEASGQKASVLPDRFIALVFDDTHISMQDAAYLRTQADKFLDGIAPTDRVGIFSTSGEMSHNFTNDKEALKKTLLSLIPHARFPVDPSVCPDINFYEANQIVNYQNTDVLNVLKQVVIDICPPVVGGPTAAQQLQMAANAIVQSRAHQVLAQGETDAQFVYRFMQDVLTHLSVMPGERAMILASPGFLMTPSQYQDLSIVIDQANHSNIVINTLDARGLYGSAPFGDIAEVTHIDPAVASQVASYGLLEQDERASVLNDFSFGTGGAYYGNSNDLASDLNQLGTAPEVSYVLGFSPQSQKMDGSFHTLKVSLAQKNKYSIQARHGYYAPRHVNDPAEQAHQDIVAAAFSRDEILGLPLQIQTQYFKTDAADARVSVVSRIDLKGIRFRKAEGWTMDDFTVATAIFDDNGNFVAGQQKVVQMKLQDQTYANYLRTGLAVKFNFDLKPGRYAVRQVVRDSEGGQMAARNGSVEIPN